jgi:hypothetical protein
VRFRATLPRLSSTVQTSPNAFDHEPILDGHLPIYSNVWRVPPNTVALCGRPAVWFALDVRLPGFRIGSLHVSPRRIRWEQDVGGHLYLVVVGDAPADAIVLEGGPFVTGTGALAPYAYSEDGFYNRGMVDFDPVPIDPPNGLSSQEFAELLFTAHREYDANQRYTAIEIPFLRVGRDSNSYAIGMLLAAGLDFRAIPKPYRARRFEWSGYPGAEDPVHRANFGGYLGEPSVLPDGSKTATFHGDRGQVTYVCIAGKPHGTARLPDGTDVALDAFGRRVLGRAEAVRHGLPIKHTAPPEHIAKRVRYPKKPDPAGAYITLVDNGVSTALELGKTYSGTIVERDDALGLATMRTEDRRIVTMPMNELGVELRDPKRVDAALQVGEFLQVGLHSDRRPRLHVRGRPDVGRSASQIGPEAAVAAVVFAVLAVAGILVYRSVRE